MLPRPKRSRQAWRSYSCALLVGLCAAGCKTPAKIAAAPSVELAAPARLPDASVQLVVHRLPAPAADESPPRPLTLAEAIDLGLQNNPRLHEAQAHAQGAQASADIAFAPFLPAVGTSFRYAGFNVPVLPGGSFVPASLTGGAKSFSLAEAGIQWTLYDFGRTAGHYGQAVDRARIRQIALDRARQTVAFEVEQAYFRVLAGRANWRIREQASRDAQSILAQTQARLFGGVVERDAVLRAEVELSRTEEERLAAWQAMRDAELSLNVTLGRMAATPLEVVDIVEQPVFRRTLEECLQTAVANRREIHMAHAAIAEADRSMQAARGEFLPKIYVRGSVIRVDSPGPLNGWIEGAGVHLDQPLYAGGEHRGELRRSQAQTAAARAALQNILDQVSLQVGLSYEAIRTDLARIQLGRAATVQARENLRLVTVRYSNGNATPTDIVDAQTALTRAESTYYTAVYGYLEGLAQLQYATGQDPLPLGAGQHEVIATPPPQQP